MKTLGCMVLLGSVAIATAETQYAPAAYIPPPTVVAIANSQPQPAQQYVYEHRIRGSMPAPREFVPNKEDILKRFRDNYGGQKPPRIVLFVNEHWLGLRTQKDDKPASREESEPPVRAQIRKREIEDAFSSPFKHGGAILVDRRLASAPAAPGDERLGSLKKNADIAVELFLEQRGFVVDNRDVKLPVMSAMAVRLSDGQIVAQVTSMGLFGLDSSNPDWNGTSEMAQMTPSEIAVEVSFALMRQMAGSTTQ